MRKALFISIAVVLLTLVSTSVTTAGEPFNDLEWYLKTGVRIEENFDKENYSPEVGIGINKIFGENLLSAELSVVDSSNFRLRAGIEQAVCEVSLSEATLKLIAGASAHMWKGFDTSGTLLFVSPDFGLLLESERGGTYLKLMGSLPLITETSKNDHNMHGKLGFSMKVGVKKRNVDFNLYYQHQGFGPDGEGGAPSLQLLGGQFAILY